MGDSDRAPRQATPTPASSPGAGGLGRPRLHFLVLSTPIQGARTQNREAQGQKQGGSVAQRHVVL